MKYLKCLTLSALAAVFFLSACSSFESGSALSSYDTAEDGSIVPMNPDSVIKEIELTVKMMDNEMGLRKRNIDDPEWIMTYFNYLAGRDIFLIEEIHSYLKYSAWTDSSKKKFLSHYTDSEGFLTLQRKEMLEEVRYLVEHSEILEEIPWLLRSRFNEKSEFSYWYVMYIVRGIDPQWIENTILPVMRDLIPLDEITAVSYLWLKNPLSLGDMDEEILFSGYPWTSLFHIIRINREIRETILELNGEAKQISDDLTESVLI